MLDYQRRGYTARGAWMGRGSNLRRDTTACLTIRKVPIDGGGYDPGGAYWGTPDNLYLVSDDDGHTDYQRAANIGAARARFPRATWTTPQEEPSESDIDDMAQGYRDCALWSTNDESTPQGGEPLDANYSDDDIAPETIASMRADCLTFARSNLADIVACLESDEHAVDWTRVGHDFWLTRNGHGCGYWDGDYPEPQADRLTDAAHAMGSVDLYLGDDGKVHS